MHAKPFSQELHAIMNGLQVQRSVLYSCPTLLSPAVTNVAGELRRAAQELENLAIEILAQQRAEANGHRAMLGDD